MMIEIFGKVKQELKSTKAEATEMKRHQKEKEKWEKGKFSLKCISAEIDTKVVERGLIGGMCSQPFS